MRFKIVTVVAAGAVGVAGVSLAAPALAASTGSATATAAAGKVDWVRDALKGLVSDKTLTQAQADQVAAALAKADPGPGRHGPGRHGPGPGAGMRGAGMAAVAKALSMSEADLRTALMDGKSFAQVAKSQNVAVSKVVDAIVTVEKAQLAQLVKDGRITQAQADERLKDLTARVTERVNSTHPDGPRDGHGGPGWGGGPGGPSTSPSSPSSPSTTSPSTTPSATMTS